MFSAKLSLIATFVLCNCAFAASPDAIEQSLAAGNPREAVSHAKTYFESDNNNSALAAELLLRSLREAGDHEELEAVFDQCVDAAKGTPHEAKAYMERARSTFDNAKDASGAVSQFNAIIAEYGTQRDIRSEALYRKGLVELDGLNQAELAKESFHSILSEDGQSPHADDAFAALAKCEAALLNPDGIAKIVNEFETRFPGSKLKSQALLTQADFANKTSGDKRTAFVAYKTLTEFDPQGVGAAIARIRLADMVRGGDYKASIEQYKAVLQDFPDLPKSLKDWANCQIGLFYWQLDNAEQAKPYLAEVFESRPADANVLRNAELTFNGINNPESIDGILALYDRGLRWRKVNVCIDLCWKDFFRIKDIVKQPFFEEYCNDPSISVEDRAQMRYRMVLIEFMVGDHGEIDNLLEKVYELQPDGITKYMAMYMEAYHHGHCGKGEHSHEIYRQILDERPGHDYLIPKTYEALASLFAARGNSLEAVLLVEEFKILYPYRHEVADFTKLQEMLFERDPEMKAFYERDRVSLLKDLNHRYKTPVLISAPPDTISTQPKEITSATGVEK